MARMPRNRVLFLLALALCLVPVVAAPAPTQTPAPRGLPVAQDGKASFTRERDVVYGRKYGTALTMDVFTPKKPNGLGVIFVVSGGWFSGMELLDSFGMLFVNPLTERGYTVFAVLH